MDFTNCDADGAPRLLRMDETSTAGKFGPVGCQDSMVDEADDGREHPMEKEQQEQKVMSSVGDQDTDIEEDESTGDQEGDEGDMSETDNRNLQPLYM